MFGIFKKKSVLEKLDDQYQKKMKEGYELQSINRRDSDQKYLEAQEILDQIDLLKKRELE